MQSRLLLVSTHLIKGWYAWLLYSLHHHSKYLVSFLRDPEWICLGWPAATQHPAAHHNPSSHTLNVHHTPCLGGTVAVRSSQLRLRLLSGHFCLLLPQAQRSQLSAWRAPFLVLY